MKISPTISQQYTPTFEQWRKIFTQTEFYADNITPLSNVCLIDFKKNKIQLKNGKKISFDGLSESQYVHVCNGGYYEDAVDINENERV